MQDNCHASKCCGVMSPHRKKHQTHFLLISTHICIRICNYFVQASQGIQGRFELWKSKQESPNSLFFSRRSDSRAQEKNSRRKKIRGNNLTRSPLTAALYYLNVWMEQAKQVSHNRGGRPYVNQISSPVIRNKASRSPTSQLKQPRIELFKQYFDWPDQPFRFIDVTRNVYFEKR